MDVKLPKQLNNIKIDISPTKGLRASVDLTKSAIKLVELLNKEIERGNDRFAFGVALFLSLAKDIIEGTLAVLLLDFVPGLNVVLQIPLLFLNVFLTYFLWGKGYFLKWKIKFWWFIATMLFDNIPVFKALPISTLMTLWAWKNVKKRARRAKAKMAVIKTMSEIEILAVVENIALIDNDPEPDED